MMCSHHKDTIVAFVRCLVLLCAANIARSTEVITVKARMAALFGLHWIISSNK